MTTKNVDTMTEAVANCYQMIATYQQTLNIVLSEINRRSEAKKAENKPDELP